MRRNSLLIVFLTVFFLISCSRSEYSTTTRHVRNGKVNYSNHHSREINSLFTHRKIRKDRTSKLPQIIRAEITPGDVSGNLIFLRTPSEQTGNSILILASTSAIPIIDPILIPPFKPQKIVPASVLKDRKANIPHFRPDTLNFAENNGQKEKITDGRKIEKNSLAGFILSIFGLIPLIGIPFAILGLVLSLTGRRKIKQFPNLYKGKGFAVAGKILGIIGICVTPLLLLGMFVALIVYGNKSSKYK